MTVCAFGLNKDNRFPVPTFVAGFYCGVVGVMIWIRSPFALHAFAFAGVAGIGWGFYRIFTEGYSSPLAVMIVGSLLMFVSCWGLADQFE